MNIKDSNIKILEQKAHSLRKLIFKTIYNAGGGHLPSAFSTADIITVLYEEILNINPKNVCDDNRDRFILSKGHACVVLYCILAEKGFFDKEILFTHNKKGSILGGHPDMHKIPGVEASTGSLGHGLSFGAGIALSGKLNNKEYKVYTLLGDGECQEGSVWESAMFASHHKLDNLIAIIDYNKLQAMDKICDVTEIAPLKEKWQAFGWEVCEIDGHNIEEILNCFKKIPFKKGKPNVIIANTVKGKGISFMENIPIWHYRMPNPDELKIAMSDLGIDETWLEDLNA